MQRPTVTPWLRRYSDEWGLRYHESIYYGQCPCGSDRYIEDCCMPLGGNLRKEAALTMPPGPSTGYAHPKCYARGLTDCSTKISKEHYMSKCVLELLNCGPEPSKTSGLKWLAPGAHPINPDAWTANILCTRHNSALSPLDAIGERLFNACAPIDVLNSGIKRLLLFNGLDVERWLLKIMCGLIAAKVMTGASTSTVPLSWVEILFSQKDPQGAQGMYFLHKKPKRERRGFSLQVFGPDASNFTLIQVRLGAFWFEMNTRMILQKVQVGACHRPDELYLRGPGFEQSILFSWPIANRTRVFSAELVADRDASGPEPTKWRAIYALRKPPSQNIPFGTSCAVIV